MGAPSPSTSRVQGPIPERSARVEWVRCAAPAISARCRDTWSAPQGRQRPGWWGVTPQVGGSSPPRLVGKQASLFNLCLPG